MKLVIAEENRRMSWSVLSLLAAAGLAGELHDGDFDKALRAHRRALVVFHAPWCARCRALAPVVQRLADAFRGGAVGMEEGVLVGSVGSEGNGELLDRFAIDAFPTLLWFDGTTKWPFAASEATPVRYDGADGYSFESVAAFVETRGGVTRRETTRHTSSSPPPPPPPPDLF